MGLFGKSAQQKRIDELAFEVSSLEDANKKLCSDLSEALRKNRELDGLATVLRDQRDTTRSELTAANAKLACLTTRGPGGRFVKVEAATAHH